MPLVELASTVSGRGQLVKFAEQRLFRVDALWPVFLHVLRRGYRFRQGGGKAHPVGHDWRRFLEQPSLLQFGQPLADEGEGSFDLLGVGVPQCHVKSGAREDDRPGAANQSRADHGHFGHATLLLDPLRSALWPRRVNAWHSILIGCVRSLVEPSC